MIEASFIVNEDGLRRKAAGEVIYEGTPVTINSDGELEAATATTKVYGLSKLDSNTHRDMAFGEYAGYGSGQLTVVTRGTCLVGSSVYNQVEVDTSTTILSAPVTVALYDTTKNYVPMQPLYIDGAGLITNAPTDKTSLLGKVLKEVTNGLLEIEVDPMATSVAADLK